MKKGNKKTRDSIPECFTELYDITRALNEANSMMEAMKKVSDISVNSQIQFLESQITDLEARYKLHSAEAEVFLKPLHNKDNMAYLAIKFHFFFGRKWEETAELLGVDSEDPANIVKHRVYRAIEKLK